MSHKASIIQTRSQKAALQATQLTSSLESDIIHIENTGELEEDYHPSVPPIPPTKTPLLHKVTQYPEEINLLNKGKYINHKSLLHLQAMITPPAPPMVQLEHPLEFKETLPSELSK
eukprot:1772662-Ditylum_brightwellii.AAC.1